MTGEKSEFLSVRDFAMILGVSQATIKRHCKAGILHGAWQWSSHGTWRIPRSTIRTLIPALSEQYDTPDLDPEEDDPMIDVPTARAKVREAKQLLAEAEDRLAQAEEREAFNQQTLTEQAKQIAEAKAKTGEYRA